MLFLKWLKSNTLFNEWALSRTIEAPHETWPGSLIMPTLHSHFILYLNVSKLTPQNISIASKNSQDFVKIVFAASIVLEHRQSFMTSDTTATQGFRSWPYFANQGPFIASKKSLISRQMTLPRARWLLFRPRAADVDQSHIPPFVSCSNRHYNTRQF